MTDYKDLKMKCTSSHPQEPFYTEGKEYDILKNETGFYIKCDEGDILEYGTTPFDLEHNLNQFLDSNFNLVNIDEVFDLELERDTYKEKYEECWQKFIKTLGELNRTDEVVLEYEKRINELEEK